MSYNNNNRSGNNQPRNNSVLGAVAGTGFRTMASAVARGKRRGRGNRGGDSDDEYFENPNRLNNNRNNRNNKQQRGRTSSRNSNKGGNNNNNRRNNNNNNRTRTSSRHSRVSASAASSRSSSVGSYNSSDDSHPGRASRNSRSVHSRSTYSRRSHTTHSSFSGYSDASYTGSDSYSDDTHSTYSRTVSSRSYSRSHATGTTTTQNRSTIATNTLKDGRSTLRNTLTSVPSNYLSSRRSASASVTGTGPRRDRSSARGSDLHSYGNGSSSDSGSSHNGRHGRSRSRSPVKRPIKTERLAIAAVLDATAAGGFECLLEDPAKQPSTKRSKHGVNKQRQRAQSFRRVESKSIDRGVSGSAATAAAEGGDDAKSVIDRKEHAAEYRLNVPILQRFCTEFSAPFGFSTAEAEVFAQQQAQDAAGFHPAIPVDELTGVPLNTKNHMNSVLMQSVIKAVNFVLLQAPQYPSEMVRAVLWRVVQSSKGPHDRLGSWKLLDGVLRCLHRRFNAFLKEEQSRKGRESTIQQERHNYEEQKKQQLVAEEENAEDAEADRQFYADISAAMAIIDGERSAARDTIRWVKVMLTEFAQLLPYLVLYCWGGDKSAAFKTAGSSSRAATKRLAQLQKEASTAANRGSTAMISSAGTSANSALATASNASEGDNAALANDIIAADLENMKRRVMDFVAGRVHGDGSMTERGQQHHATLLRHHHTLESQAATTATPRSTITTQSRFAVGNGMHLTTSKAKALVTEEEMRVINLQIFAEYEAILRGWNILFASDKYYISFIHIRRAVGDYAALLSDHDASMGLKMGAAHKSISKHREGSDLYHFALKAAHLKQSGERSVSQQLGDGIYHRQREVFETFLLPPARMVDALWRFRRAEPRPSLVASVLAQYGYPIFKTTATAAAEEASAAGSSSQAIYDVNGAAGRRSSYASSSSKSRPENNIVFSFPRNAEEVAHVLGHAVNDRLSAWVNKAAESCGGCLSCDVWTHTFNTCPYRPARFVTINRQVVASLTATEAVDLLKATAGRSYADRSIATANLAALAAGGISADRAGSDATVAGISLEQQGIARKQLVFDVLDAAVERCSAGTDMDALLNALDVILRQSSTGRERQALALLATYRLQPSKMLQFTNAASNSVAPVSRRSGRRKQNVIDFGRSGRTPAAEKLLAYLNQECRFYESGRLRNAMETLYFRYLCIPHNDAVMVQQLQRDVALIRENRCFVDVLADDEAPLQSRIFAVTPKSVLAAAISRVKRVTHLLDPCSLELSPCCAGAAVDAIRAYNAQHVSHEPLEATEPWDWYVVRQVLRSERLISQTDGLPTSLEEYQNKFQYASELVERLGELADNHDRREDGRVAASRLRLSAHIIEQCGFCTSCNRIGHTRRTCAELASSLIRNGISPSAKGALGIRSITTARIAVPSMVSYIRHLQATRNRAPAHQRDEIERDIRNLPDLFALLSGQQEGLKPSRGPARNQRPLQIPAAVALISRRVGGVRSGYIDIGSTAVYPPLPPAVNAAVQAITTQTGLSLAEVRFCPDECLALFHAASYHHLTPHIAAIRSRQFPNLVITTGVFEDDALEERATQDRIASASYPTDLSSQTLAQLSNPSAKRRYRAYALPPEHFTGIAFNFDDMTRYNAVVGVVSEGLNRALNAQQLCRDRYLDLAAYLMRTTGSGGVDADGVADYETVYSLFFPQSSEARVVRQQLLARGQALHDELHRRITARVSTVNPAAPISQRPYNTVYELERDYFLRNLSADTDKAAYTFFAAVQARSYMSARLRRFTQERAVPLPNKGPVMNAVAMTPAPSQNYASVPASQQGSSSSQLPAGMPQPPAGMVFSVPPTIAFRGRLSSGLLFSQEATGSAVVGTAAEIAAAEAVAAEADAIVSSMITDGTLESPDYAAAIAEAAADVDVVGQKRSRSNQSPADDDEEPATGKHHAE